MNKRLRNFLAEIGVATAVTLTLLYVRNYGALFRQLLPLIYLFALCEITYRHAFPSVES